MHEGIMRQSLVYKKLIVIGATEIPHYLCFNGMTFILIRHIGIAEAEMSKLTLRRNDKAANSRRFFGRGKKKKRQSENVKVAQGLE